MNNRKMSDDYEKQRLVENDEIPHPPAARKASFKDRLCRHILPCILLLLSVSILFRKVFVCHHHYEPGKHLKPLEDNDTTKVALEAHIMSKCPDAKACLEQLVVPSMAQVSNKVKFKLSYIGTLDPDSDDVQCKHGPGECLGNIIQLCAAHVYPEPVIYLGFANCMTSQYSRIPNQDLIEECSMEHGVDFEELNDCISQEGEGMHLLRESVKHSAKNNVTISCTVRLEGQVRCIRDGGRWYNCPGGSSVSDLVSDIETLYHHKNSV